MSQPTISYDGRPMTTARPRRKRPTEAEIERTKAERLRRYPGPDESINPPPGFLVADAVGAMAAVVRFWEALAADDDQATVGLLYAMSRLKNGLIEKGLAAQLRERMGLLTVGDCASMGVSSTVRVLPDGTWAFICWQAKRGEEIVWEPTAKLIHAWIVINAGGRWQIWGAPEADQLAAATFVRLPLEMPAGSPIQ